MIVTLDHLVVRVRFFLHVDGKTDQIVRIHADKFRNHRDLGPRDRDLARFGTAWERSAHESNTVRTWGFERAFPSVFHVQVQGKVGGSRP